METWTWLAAYLVGFLLLQVYLYRYFMKESAMGSSERTTPLSDGRTSTVESPDDVPDGDLVTCQSCGAYNETDQMFTFCRNCGSRLE